MGVLLVHIYMYTHTHTQGPPKVPPLPMYLRNEINYGIMVKYIVNEFEADYF